MFELIETKPPVDVQDSEYQRLLGYPKHRPLEGRARELADMARTWYQENGAAMDLCPGNRRARIPGAKGLDWRD